MFLTVNVAAGICPTRELQIWEKLLAENKPYVEGNVYLQSLPQSHQQEQSQTSLIGGKEPGHVIVVLSVFLIIERPACRLS